MKLRFTVTRGQKGFTDTGDLLTYFHFDCKKQTETQVVKYINVMHICPNALAFKDKKV